MTFTNQLEQSKPVKIENIAPGSRVKVTSRKDRNNILLGSVLTTMKSFGGAGRPALVLLLEDGTERIVSDVGNTEIHVLVDGSALSSQVLPEGAVNATTKPSHVVAVQVTRSSSHAIAIIQWAAERGAIRIARADSTIGREGDLLVPARGGSVAASSGDWIIKTGDGLIVLDPATFSARYDINTAQ